MLKKVTTKQWVALIVMLIVAVALTLLFYYLYISGSTQYPASYVTALIGFVYLFVGWVVPNNIEFKFRRKTAQYSGELPEDIKMKKFSYRFPLISASVIVLILSVIFDYILK